MRARSGNLIDAAYDILLEPDPSRKVELTRDTAELWRGGRLTLKGFKTRQEPLERPARDEQAV